MKKLLVTLTVMGIMVGSLATLSSASHTVIETKYANKYNGSYYYDEGWRIVNVKGANTKTSVVVYLHKNGQWKARNQTFVKGSESGNRRTCKSKTIQGKGADGVYAISVDI